MLPRGEGEALEFSAGQRQLRDRPLGDQAPFLHDQHLVEMIETTHLNSNADDNPPSQKVKQTPTSTLKPTVLTELSEKQTQATKKTTLHLASKIKRKTYRLSTD